MRPALSLLEEFPNYSALPAMWRDAAGEQYPALKILCLEVAPKMAISVPCPNKCGCNHYLIKRHDKTAALAICRCEPAHCPDFEVSIEEATPLRINRARLGRAICRAFDCPSKPVDLGLPNTSQIGSWSADAIPIILTLEGAPFPFRHIISELARRIDGPFILISPTADQLDALGQEVLASVGAALFALETIFTLTPSGLLLPVKTPGELLMKFNPAPKNTDLSVAQQAFALVRALDAKCSFGPPSLITVFSEFCIDAMSISQIAKRHGSSRTSIRRRLGLIRKVTKIDPHSMRAMSAHLQPIQETLYHENAKLIHPNSLNC